MKFIETVSYVFCHLFPLFYQLTQIIAMTVTEFYFVMLNDQVLTKHNSVFWLLSNDLLVMLICCSSVISGSNLVLLCWSCVLVRHVYNNTELCNDAQWIRLVAVQCLALHGALSAGTACVCEAARKKLHRVWREVQLYGNASQCFFASLKLFSTRIIQDLIRNKDFLPPPIL